MEAIVGTFRALAVEPQKGATATWTQTFDATAHVLEMDIEAIRSIKDATPSSEAIGRHYAEHNGPCEVTIEKSVAAFFGASDVRAITPRKLARMRRRHARELSATRPQSITLGFTLTLDGPDQQAQLERIQHRMARALATVAGTEQVSVQASTPVYL